MTRIKDVLVVVKGGGELGTGVAHKLFRCGFKVCILEKERPTVERRMVSFASAIYLGEFEVEGVKAKKVKDVNEARRILELGKSIPILVDPRWEAIKRLNPRVVVDAIMAKKNLGTSMNEAPLVLGLGPGFKAGEDVHVVIETLRGHNMGRVIESGSAEEDTGEPEPIMGYTFERILYAPSSGAIKVIKDIGELVDKDDIVCVVNGLNVRARIGGIIRGLLMNGIEVKKGQKIGEIDPRGIREYVYTISDRARAVAGGVLEAILSSFRGEVYLG